MKVNKQEVKETIESLLTKIESEIEELKELTKPIAPENAIGRISRMDAINNKSINEAALRTAQDKFRKLQISLKHLDEPDFGICVRCSEPIPLARILLVPESNRCVNCA